MLSCFFSICTQLLYEHFKFLFQCRLYNIHVVHWYDCIIVPQYLLCIVVPPLGPQPGVTWLSCGCVLLQHSLGVSLLLIPIAGTDYLRTDLFSISFNQFRQRLKTSLFASEDIGPGRERLCFWVALYKYSITITITITNVWIFLKFLPPCKTFCGRPWAQRPTSQDIYNECIQHSELYFLLLMLKDSDSSNSGLGLDSDSA